AGRTPIACVPNDRVMSLDADEAARENELRVGSHDTLNTRSPTMFATWGRQWSRRHSGRDAAGGRRGCLHRLEWEALELRGLMAPLMPGNPVSIGTPLTFSAVGGTNPSGAALAALTSFETAIGGSKNTAPAPQASGFRTITWDGVKLDGNDFGGGANTTV